MADLEIIDLTAASTLDGSELTYALQGGADRKATIAQIRAGLLSEVTDRAINTVVAGPASGSAGPVVVRALVADDIPTLPLAKLATLTVSRALVSNGSGVVTVSAVTATELGFLAGVTSAIQDQLDAKQASDPTLAALALLATLGSPLQVIRTNAAGTAFEHADPASGGGYDKLTASGANGGTLTLDDDTAGIGVSQFAVTDGDGQGTTPQVAFGPPAASGLGVSFYARPTTAYVEIMTRDRTGFVNVAAASYSTFNTNFDNSGVLMGLAGALAWTSGAAYWQGSTDTGLTRAPIGGVVRATNGSSGSGGFEGVSLQGASSTALAAATPTAFVDIPVASGARIGGIIEYCVEADDGTDFQIESGVIQFAAVNKAGTVTTATPTATGTPLQVLNSGTLTAAFTATAGADKVTINCEAASSLTETTLRIRFRVHVNSSTTAIAVAPL